MTIPDYQSVMLPLLRLLSRQEEVRSADAIAVLAAEMKLTDGERAEMLPSGISTTFGSRVGWAKTYLKQAGLIDQPRRGVMRLTGRGSEVLKNGPPRVDNDLLETFQEFRDFRARSRQRALHQPIGDRAVDSPPKSASTRL